MPPKVILYIACSLDGFIAGKNNEIDWLFSDQDYGYKAFYESIGTVIMGRKTYRLTLSFPAFSYPDKTCYVLSNTKSGQNKDVQFTNNAKDLIEKLKKKEKKDIWLAGGGLLIREFLEQDLIDELRIFIHPLILGEGIPLFHPCPKTQLELINTQKYSSGLVELHYRKKR